MLKEREQKILDYESGDQDQGYPTVWEICTALYIKSTSTAHGDTESLVRQGYLVKDPLLNRARALMVDPQEAFPVLPAEWAAATGTDAGAAGTDRSGCRRDPGRPAARRRRETDPRRRTLETRQLPGTVPLRRKGHELHAPRTRREHDRSRYHGW